MKPALFFLTALTCTLAACDAFLLGQPPDARKAEAALKQLPSDWVTEYKVDPYLRAALALQSLGKEQACSRLRALARDKDEGWKVFPLCRLLFSAKPGAQFRRTAIGAVGFLGGTDYKDWPLDPFELVGGVPFVITNGDYFLFGIAEQPGQYLEYCIKSCNWNDLRLGPKTEAEKRKALEKLLSSDKWKRPLTANERDLLRAQIK